MNADETLGGYLAAHKRPPAFEGSDGLYYSVDTFVTERTDSSELTGRFRGALLFVRWSPDGEQPVGHLETDYLAWAEERDVVRDAIHALTLHEIKEHLDRLVDEHAELPDW